MASSSRTSGSALADRGLGLKAQCEAVKAYPNNGDRSIVDDLTEVESGKNSDRPALGKALAVARQEAGWQSRRNANREDAWGLHGGPAEVRETDGLPYRRAAQSP